MKVNRTYTMELKTLELLARKKNKSKIINIAVKKYFTENEEFDISDLTTHRIFRDLIYREDVPEHLKLLIKLHLTQ
jgi:hypothetical protein|tara:strand:- start:435 stop:662 length:228 start_codon:yes stop_codon:yes gene_type:complete